MNLTRIGLFVGGGTLATGGVVTAVVLLSSSKSGINYAGKTLKSKYPLLSVPEGDQIQYHNKQFWLEKTKKLY